MRAATTSRLILVCQGATAATRAILFPKGDEPLDPAARAPLVALRMRLGWRDHAVAAPSRAAHETAEAIAAYTTTEPALRDCDYGTWAGRAMAAIAVDDTAGLAHWLDDPAAAPHGGEPIVALLDRVRHWLAACGADPANRLAVAPPLVVRAVATAALDLPPCTILRLDAAPLTVSRFTAQAGRWRLASFSAPP